MTTFVLQQLPLEIHSYAAVTEKIIVSRNELGTPQPCP